MRRPVISFDLLFEEPIATRKPLSFERLSSGPEFGALATSVQTHSLRVLGDFADREELLRAVRASASLPRLGDQRPRTEAGRRVSSSCVHDHLGYRQPALSALGESLGLGDAPGLVELMRARGEIYRSRARGDAPSYRYCRALDHAGDHQSPG